MKLDVFDSQRRDLLRLGTAGLAALAGGSPAEGATEEARNPFKPDLAIELTAAPRQAALRAGSKTPVWSYQARVTKGDADSVQTWNGGWLGPILRVRRGQRVRVDFVNKIDQPSIVNWHGLHVPADMMGLPRYEVAPGGRYRYEFEVLNHAGTYWYHAMAAGHTPEQVYFGLVGLLYVTDDEERALALPRGEYDLPVVIQDRDFDTDNGLRYLPGTGPDAPGESEAANRRGGMPGAVEGGMMGGGMRSMMTRMMGFFGDTICVNGKPGAELRVATHTYRLRVLNASNARTYKLAWQDGKPLVVIATDGGLLDEPVEQAFVMLTPGQRVELWADFSGDEIGAEHHLVSRAFSGSMGMMGSGTSNGPFNEMMGRMMSGPAPSDGAAFPILRVTVTRKSGEVLELPKRLAAVPHLRAEDAVNHEHPRVFRVTMGHMRWGFNGRSMQMGHVARDEVVKLGSTEIWEFENSPMMAHAIHIHGLQFQVLGWSGGTGANVAAGRVRQGWQDTVLLMPGERVRLVMRFADFTGLYAYQCHMLEHAATGLMRDYEVGA